MWFYYSVLFSGRKSDLYNHIVVCFTRYAFKNGSLSTGRSRCGWYWCADQFTGNRRSSMQGKLEIRSVYSSFFLNISLKKSCPMRASCLFIMVNQWLSKSVQTGTLINRLLALKITVMPFFRKTSVRSFVLVKTLIRTVATVLSLTGSSEIIFHWRVPNRGKRMLCYCTKTVAKSLVLVWEILINVSQIAKIFLAYSYHH